MRQRVYKTGAVLAMVAIAYLDVGKGFSIIPPKPILQKEWPLARLLAQANAANLPDDEPNSAALSTIPPTYAQLNESRQGAELLSQIIQTAQTMQDDQQKTVALGLIA